MDGVRESENISKKKDERRMEEKTERKEKVE